LDESEWSTVGQVPAVVVADGGRCRVGVGVHHQVLCGVDDETDMAGHPAGAVAGPESTRSPACPAPDAILGKVCQKSSAVSRPIPAPAWISPQDISPEQSNTSGAGGSPHVRRAHIGGDGLQEPSPGAGGKFHGVDAERGGAVPRVASHSGHQADRDRCGPADDRPSSRPFPDRLIETLYRLGRGLAARMLPAPDRFGMPIGGAAMTSYATAVDGARCTVNRSSTGSRSGTARPTGVGRCWLRGRTG